jgi:hypothetical protein
VSPGTGVGLKTDNRATTQNANANIIGWPVDAKKVTTKQETPPTVARKYSRPERAAFVTPPNLEDPHIAELLQMHTYKRPGGSKTELAFCKKYIESLPGWERDIAGNYTVTVGEKPTVLWSSHTDTVHKTDGKQKLVYGAGFLSLSDKEAKPECLGADCTVGVWIMRQMILRNIPGLYIFHAFEETGGDGSIHIAENRQDLLEGIKYAIAFDRKGISSVISHQFTRCASDAFSQALADALNTPGVFVPDDTGTFTDTANYVNLIPECTNISVGYWSQHTSAEILDVGFAEHVLNRVCALDVNALPAERDHTVEEKYDWNEYGYSKFYTSKYHTTTNRKYSGYNRITSYEQAEIDELADICERFPNLVARFLMSEGFGLSDVESYDWVEPSDKVLDLTKDDER